MGEIVRGWMGNALGDGGDRSRPVHTAALGEIVRGGIGNALGEIVEAQKLGMAKPA